jgi:hypothetical protein
MSNMPHKGETTMTMERLDASLASLLANASPNFTQGDTHEADTLYVSRRYDKPDGTRGTDYQYEVTFDRPDDCALVSAAINALPELLEAVAERDRYKAALEKISNSYDGHPAIMRGEMRNMAREALVESR